MVEKPHVTKQTGGLFELDGYSDDDVRAMLRGILGTPFSLLREKARELLRVVEDVRGDRQPGLLSCVLTNYGLVPTCCTPGVGVEIPQEEITSVGKYYNDILFAFTSCMQDNPTPEELARRLLNYLKQRFATLNQRALALTVVLADNRIPYRQLDSELYEELILDDGEMVNLPITEDGVPFIEMTPDQQLLYHAFWRLGSSASFSRFLTKLIRRQSGEAGIFNVLAVFSNEIQKKSFDDGVKSAESATYEEPPEVSGDDSQGKQDG